MVIGEVVRQLWLCHSAKGWQGYRLVAVKKYKCDGSQAGEIIAVDNLGSRVGEKVIVGSSSRVRDLIIGPGAPVKSVVVAIVDTADVPEMGPGNIFLDQSPKLREAE